MSLKYVHYVVSAYDGATLRKIEGLGFIETVVTLRQHAKKLYKSVWFSQRVLHYPLTCKCSSSITKIIDKALTFFFQSWHGLLAYLLLCAKVFPTLLEYLPIEIHLKIGQDYQIMMPWYLRIMVQLDVQCFCFENRMEFNKYKAKTKLVQFCVKNEDTFKFFTS